MKKMSRKPQWLHVTMQDHKVFWFKMDWLFRLLPEKQRQQHFRTLDEGRAIHVPGQGPCIAIPMSVEDKKRLSHLRKYEVQGYRLAYFTEHTAAYYKGPLLYYSMNEMADGGFFPKANIAADPLNNAVFTPYGTPLDVFVPVDRMEISFYPAALPTSIDAVIEETVAMAIERALNR